MTACCKKYVCKRNTLLLRGTEHRGVLPCVPHDMFWALLFIYGYGTSHSECAIHSNMTAPLVRLKHGAGQLSEL